MSAPNLGLNPSHGSWLGKLRAAREALDSSPTEDPWAPALSNLKGRVGADGVERISTYDVFDTLEVPVRRRASLTVRLSRVMRGLGWSNIRAHGLNSHSYRDRVRGYAREAPGHPAAVRLPNRF
jgi:hypothetical protein